VANVKKYIEKVPGRKEVLETNIAAEVAKKHSNSLLSVLRPVFASEKTK